jgi:hypothetical protein
MQLRKYIFKIQVDTLLNCLLTSLILVHNLFKMRYNTYDKNKTCNNKVSNKSLTWLRRILCEQTNKHSCMYTHK